MGRRTPKESLGWSGWDLNRDPPHGRLAQKPLYYPRYIFARGWLTADPTHHRSPPKRLAVLSTFLASFPCEDPALYISQDPGLDTTDLPGIPTGSYYGFQWPAPLTCNVGGRQGRHAAWSPHAQSPRAPTASQVLPRVANAFRAIGRLRSQWGDELPKSRLDGRGGI